MLVDGKQKIAHLKLVLFVHQHLLICVSQDCIKTTYTVSIVFIHCYMVRI